MSKKEKIVVSSTLAMFIGLLTFCLGYILG